MAFASGRPGPRGRLVDNRGGCDDGRQVAGSLYCRFQDVEIGGVGDRVVRRRHDGSQILQELGDLDGRRIRYVQDVLVTHFKLSRQEKARGVSKVQVINDWNDRAVKLRTVDTEAQR